jgi:hypothetical protein
MILLNNALFRYIMHYLDTKEKNRLMLHLDCHMCIAFSHKAVNSISKRLVKHQACINWIFFSLSFLLQPLIQCCLWNQDVDPAHAAWIRVTECPQSTERAASSADRVQTACGAPESPVCDRGGHCSRGDSPHVCWWRRRRFHLQQDKQKCGHPWNMVTLAGQTEKAVKTIDRTGKGWKTIRGETGTTEKQLAVLAGDWGHRTWLKMSLTGLPKQTVTAKQTKRKQLIRHVR